MGWVKSTADPLLALSWKPAPRLADSGGCRAAWGKGEGVQVVLGFSASVREHPWVKRGWSQSLRVRSARKP